AGMAWFIDASASCGVSCDGRLTTPYASLTAFTAVNNGAGQNPKAGDAIFVYQNSSAYTGNISLLTNQGLYGQDHTAASFSVLTGLAVPTSSVALLPGGLAADGVFTTISSSAGNVIGLLGGNKMRGLAVNTSGTATGISGNTSGTLTISEVSVAG